MILLSEIENIGKTVFRGKIIHYILDKSLSCLQDIQGGMNS